MAYINKETAAEIRKELNIIAKEYGYKLSVRVENHSTLNVAIVEGKEIDINSLLNNDLTNKYIKKIYKKDNNLNEDDFRKELLNIIPNLQHWETNEAYLEYNALKEFKGYDVKNNSNLTGTFKEFINKIDSTIRKIGNWYDNSDTMIDYFDIAFYYSIKIGRWDTPYKVNNNIKKAEPKKVNSDIDFKEIIKNGTIEDYTHTKTGEKLKLLKLNDRLSKEDFKAFLAYIKAENIGYWSKWAKGVILTKEISPEPTQTEEKQTNIKGAKVPNKKDIVAPDTAKATSATVKELKENNQDFEWYPTTSEIIEVIKQDIKTSGLHNYNQSVLDIGAGDGRVLEAFKDIEKIGRVYAIEKSDIHIKALIKKGIGVLSTDFYQTSLIDKKADFIFCNPPYSDYKEWVIKILNEAQAPFIYLVIPQRWRENEEIKHILEERNIKKEMIQTLLLTDFESADRKARAKVEVIKISLKFAKTAKSFFFNKFIFKSTHKKEVKKDDNKNEIADGKDTIKLLVELYNKELNELIANYQALGELNERILKDVGIDLNSLQDTFYYKISNLKQWYWTNLLNRLDSIKRRLTSKSIDKIWSNLDYKDEIDFTEENARAVILYFLDMANKYKDDQFIEVYENMFNEKNIKAYKSNKKAFSFSDRWEGVKNNTHYYLTNKIVFAGYFANYTEQYGINLYISRRGISMLQDLKTIILGLGYESEDLPSDYQIKIEPNKEKFIYLKEATKHPLKEKAKTNFGTIEEVFTHTTGNEIWYQYLINGEYYHQDLVKTDDKILIRYKGFKNGNLHININKKVMDKINVEFARLKGWVKSPKEASEEMGVDIKTAQSAFNALKLDTTGIKLLGL